LPPTGNALSPLGAIYRPVLRQITRWKSARFHVRAIFSSPILSITERRSLFPSSSTYYSIRQSCDCPCLPYRPDPILGLPRSVQATGLGRFCLFAGDTNVSVSAPSKRTTDHIEPLTAAFGPLSLTTFNSSSLYVNHSIQPSASPGRNYRTHDRSLTESTVPKGWLHCQSAQHPTVTSDAPLLGYEGLNPRSCRPLMHLKTIACTAFVATKLLKIHPNY